jgi:hypothetical protein
MMTVKENKLRYRLYCGELMAFVDVDQEKRTIRNVELEGELPLLVVNPIHRSATLWMLYEDLTDEYQFDADTYTYDEEMGTTHTWKWYDKNGNVLLRVVAHYPADNEQDDVAQVVVYLEDPDGVVPMQNSLFTFMTDFNGWVFTETYGDVADDLTALGRYLSETRPKGEEE